MIAGSKTVTNYTVGDICERADFLLARVFFSGIFLLVNKQKNTIIGEDCGVCKKIAAGLLALLMLFLVVQVFNLKNQVSDLKESSEQANKAATYITDFGTDLNEIRELLLLPTKNYSFTEENSSSDETEEDSVIADMFTYIDQLKISKKITANMQILDEYFASAETQALLMANGLTQQAGTYSVQDTAGRVLYTITISDEDGEFYMIDYYGVQIEAGEDIIQTFETQIANISSLTDKIAMLDQARADISDMLYQEGAIYDALMEKGMWAELEEETDSSYEYYIVNQDQAKLATINLSKYSEGAPAFSWWDLSTGEALHPDFNEAEIIDFINELDSRTYLEKKIADNREKLESLLQDPAFASILEENSITMSGAREDDTGIYYDLTDVDGNILSTIYIDKNTGKVMVTNGGETIELMAAVSKDDTKKKIWICLKPSLNTRI